MTAFIRCKSGRTLFILTLSNNLAVVIKVKNAMLHDAGNVQRHYRDEATTALSPDERGDVGLAGTFGLAR